MKKILYTLFISVCLASCSLKENPEGYVVKENFYQTEDQCYSALRAIYTPIHYIYNGPFLMATEACTDIWYCDSADDNAKLAINPANPGCATTVWTYAYKGVARANECVSCIAESPLDDAVKAPMVAEAVAMRALYYYILTSFFGDVPFYTYPVSDIAAMEAIRNLPRKSATEIRDELYKDLKDNALPYFTDENGLKCRFCEVSNQHAGYALTLMVMAKMAMWNQKWDDALYALNLLEQTYGELTEENYPIEQIQWRHKNVAESIFEIQHEWSVNGVKFYGAVSGLMTPACSGNGIYDGVYMPELAMDGVSTTPVKATKHYAVFRSKNNAKEENAANKNGIFPAMPMMFTNETYDYSGGKRYCTVIDLNALQTGITANGSKLDRRIRYTLGMGNLENGDTFKTLKSIGFFFGGPKQWCPNMTKNYDSNNYRIMRYADAVLMQAECYCMNGDMSSALGYLNKVKLRAGIDMFDTESQDDVMAEIRNERARELGGEFQRKFDLVRWGIWFDATSTYNESSRLKSNIRACHRYYPIPDTEVALSNGALNNKEYETNETL